MCSTTSKRDLSSDEKFIILENVSDNYDGTKTNLVFEKELLMDSPLFDNESFCFLHKIYILDCEKQSQNIMNQFLQRL